MVFRAVKHNSRITKAPPTRKRKSAGTAREVPAQTDVRLGRIIKLLMDYATVVVSGTKIADEIHTTRSEVWRLVQQLRAFGVSITGHPATGYRLKNVPDLLLPDILRPLVRGTIFGASIKHYFKTGSTNTMAMQAASDGAAEGTVFVAEQQTAGRGRGAHQWHSPQSEGLYCSVVLRPSLPPTEALILSLAGGLAAQSAIQSIRPQTTVDLKWPNDLLIESKKVCGILTEMNAEATRVRHLVMGFGMNVNQEEFPAGLDEATSLQLATGTEWSRVDLCAALLKSLDREYRNLLGRPDARDSVMRRFQERSSSVRGHKVRIEEEGHSFEGVTDGLDARGFLQVRTLVGLRVVLSGSVRLR